MSSDEQIELLRKYEEEYDPFGLNDVLNSSTSANGGVQPLWNSGNTLMGSHEWKTHEKIAIQALAELETYLSKYEHGAACLGEGQDPVTFIFDLAIASALPDRVWNGVVKDQAFAGHFYNPETGKNTLGQTIPTAKTNAISEWNAACSFLSNSYLLYGEENKSGIEKLGCALHYIQDVCEPHHSSNITVKLFNNSHGKFEEYAYNNFSAFADCSIQHTPAVMSRIAVCKLGILWNWRHLHLINTLIWWIMSTISPIGVMLLIFAWIKRRVIRRLYFTKFYVSEDLFKGCCYAHMLYFASLKRIGGFRRFVDFVLGCFDIRCISRVSAVLYGICECFCTSLSNGTRYAFFRTFDHFGCSADGGQFLERGGVAGGTRFVADKYGVHGLLSCAQRAVGCLFFKYRCVGESSVYRGDAFRRSVCGFADDKYRVYF